MKPLDEAEANDYDASGNPGQGSSTSNILGLGGKRGLSKSNK